MGILALGASLDLLSEYGLAADQSKIADRVLEITELACQKLQSVGAAITSSRDRASASGIVTFDVPHADNAELRKQCLERQIVLSCRNGRLRISPHAYNDESDLDALIAVIAAKA